jgi:hypothetical protein
VKHNAHILLPLFCCFAAFVPTDSQAFDNAIGAFKYDSKSYGGNFCSSGYSVDIHHGITNRTSGPIVVFCPIVKDNHSGTGKLEYAKVYLNHRVQAVSNCTLYAYDHLGQVVASTSFTTGSFVGNRAFYPYDTVNGYLPKTASEGTLVLGCGLAAEGTVISYLITERSP